MNLLVQEVVSEDSSINHRALMHLCKTKVLLGELVAVIQIKKIMGTKERLVLNQETKRNGN